MGVEWIGLGIVYKARGSGTPGKDSVPLWSTGGSIERSSLFLSPNFPDEVGKLGGDQLFHCESDSARRARHTEDHRVTIHAGDRPGEHSAGADIFPTEVPEQFAESVDLLFEETSDGFVGGVASGNTGSPVGEDGLAISLVCNFDYNFSDPGGIIRNDLVVTGVVSCICENFFYDRAALVVLFGAGVADGKNGAGDCVRGLFLVVFVGQGGGLLCCKAQRFKNPWERWDAPLGQWPDVS